MTTPLETLRNTLPQVGHLDWIGLRPGRAVEMIEVEQVQAIAGRGLEGDRFKGRASSTRQVTLVQAEHLVVMGQLLGGPPVPPEIIRRNLVVSGINLLALKGQRFCIGDVLLEGTTPCAPCSKMEAALGPGGYNALRGHGGLCARILHSGTLALGDTVQLVLDAG